MKIPKNLALAAAAALFTLGCSGMLHAADGAELYKAKICNTCHGDDGNQPVMAAYPKVAGQNAEYALQQMKDIRDGKRTNGLSAAMQGVVSTVTDEEFAAIAAWLATQ
jgi:cytochrome c